MTKAFIFIKIHSSAISLKLNFIRILWKLFSKMKFTLTANIIYAFKFPTLDVINVHLLSHRHTVSSILSKWVTLIVTSTTTSDLSFSPLTQKMSTQTAGLTPFFDGGLTNSLGEIPSKVFCSKNWTTFFEIDFHQNFDAFLCIIPYYILVRY